MKPEITPVREAHRLNRMALTDFLGKNLPGFYGNQTIGQFGYGQSNPTFLLSAAGRPGIPFRLDFFYRLQSFPPGGHCSGVYKRGLDGNASSDNTRRYRDYARFLSDSAWSLVTKKSLKENRPGNS